jgi:hypothetical protein
MTALNIRPLLEKIQARLEELTATMEFSTAAGVPAALAVHLYRVPNALLADGAAPYPFALLRPVSGGDGDGLGTLRVWLLFGLTCAEEDGTGDEQLEALAAVVCRLSENQAFYPHALRPEIIFRFGEGESGAQAHPDYQLTAELVFDRQSVFLNQ